MHLPDPTVRRRSLLTAGLAAIPLLASAPAWAGGTFPEPGPFPPRDALLTYADMVRTLDQIERTSRGAVTVSTLRELGITPGVSEAGRDLYVATVGTGDTHVWLQGRIHGNEPYGTDTLLDVLRSVGSNGSRTFRQIREELTLHVIPMYNPDGTELYIRHTVLADGTKIDLNRDWAPGAFRAKESVAWYTYWTQVKPAFGLDIHHQGLKYDAEGDPVTMSLGVSLAPSGPTLPFVKGGRYDVQTRQMAGYVYEQLSGAGFTNIDRYSVGGPREIDIKGGVASAVMLGLDWGGLNPTGHSHPMVFFETYGGLIGQKSRGKAIQQNVRGTVAFLEGLATGAMWATDPMLWHRIPHPAYIGYQTDTGVVDGWPAYPPVMP